MELALIQVAKQMAIGIPLMVAALNAYQLYNVELQPLVLAAKKQVKQ